MVGIDLLLVVYYFVLEAALLENKQEAKSTESADHSIDKLIP